MAAPDIALRSGSGVSMIEGPDGYAARPVPQDSSGSCRAMAFSPKGETFAWANANGVQLVKTDGKAWKEHKTLPEAKVYELQFSPTGKYITCWKLYGGKPTESNMFLYNVESGELVHSFTQAKQSGWQPEWSSDEKIFARLVGNDVLFYEDLKFEEPAATLSGAKVAAFSLSPSPLSRSYVFCHFPGSASLPSFGKMFKYPNFNQAIASKGFFQGESVQFYWNERGTSVLFMTSTEADKNGTTYYGRQTLHYADSKGETSMVQLGKEGPIYDVAWHPKGKEFCVVYGTMPARATLFNLKCDPIYEFGEGHRNSIYYSPNGTRVLLCGFGNLPGKMEIWDTETKKLLQKCDAPCTTGIVWDPRSECFITHTTAPRLRIDNGFKVWHSSGALMYEYKLPSGELYEMLWQPGNFPASQLSNKKPKSIAPPKSATSKQPYRPPAAQGVDSGFKIHDEQEKPHYPGQNTTDGPSKAALKQKKKRDAKKAKKAEEQATAAVTAVVTPVVEADGSDEDSLKKPLNSVRTFDPKMKNPSTNDPDKDKKIKNIIKKLEAIDKLKSDIATGKALDSNQMAKIAKENDLLKELGELYL